MKNTLAALLLALMAACQRAEKTPVPEPRAQNAVTDYVDRGAATMQRAQTVADVENARIRQQNDQQIVE